MSTVFVDFEGTTHSSVAPVDGGSSPPKARAAVLEAPDPPRAYLPVFKSATSDQLAPFQSSVIAW